MIHWFFIYNNSVAIINRNRFSFVNKNFTISELNNEATSLFSSSNYFNIYVQSSLDRNETTFVNKNLYPTYGS